MRFKRYFSPAYATRVLIVLIDWMLVVFSFISAILLRFNFAPPEKIPFFLPTTLLLVSLVRLIFFKVFRTYSGILRFTGEKDITRIFFAISAGTTLLVVVRSIGIFDNYTFIPYSIIIIDYVLALFILVSYRIIIRVLFWQTKKEKYSTENVIIFGAGQAGHITKRSIDEDNQNKMNVVGFFDDNVYVNYKTLGGVNIYNPKIDFEKIVKKCNVKKVIIAIQQISTKRKQEIVDLSLEMGLTVMQIPPVEKWLNGELSVQQIKNIKIEDLLNRAAIRLDVDDISKEINDKVILVTGGAGSIGSEMTRQILKFSPKQLLVLDQAESPLVELHLELQEKFCGNNVVPIVADITDENRLSYIFKKYKPEIIFHAAAYKHVPIMELQPQEAIKVNIKGTKNLADFSLKFDVKKFVMVSTDKAVNPTNVMGASKRIAEIYTQSLNGYYRNGKTKFITTRFGNVLGSNGSVVPRFKRQIQEGGPITVTHPDITRYFMTIPEACQLVLEAGTMGNGGEIFLFDMGDSVKIVDLAKKMIQLAGFKVDDDIKIEYTGLRPGEKLYEELLNNKENTLPTHHSKILKAQVRQQNLKEVSEQITYLIESLKENNDFELVKQMKWIVPEFVSNASKYEVLDVKPDTPKQLLKA